MGVPNRVLDEANSLLSIAKKDVFSEGFSGISSARWALRQIWVQKMNKIAKIAP